MTRRHMSIFVSVYQHCSITKAAESLHLAQPSVSLAIRELEDYYGIRLFERIGRRIQCTECGKQFYSYALHIVSLFDDMELKIRDWEALGTLRIGASITIGTYVLPALVEKFKEYFPEMKVEVSIKNSALIEQHIMDNTIDLGLIETKPEQLPLISIPFMQDQLCVIASPTHPLTRQPIATLKDLTEYDFLMRENGSAGRDLLHSIFLARQLQIRILWESTSTQAIVKGVAAGLGISVLPYLLLKKDIEDGTVVRIPIQEPFFHRVFHMIHHKNKYLSSTIKAFMELCQKCDQVQVFP